MQIEIDPLSTVAIYQQIRDRVVEAVASGRLIPGDQLSSVRQVALDFGINVATVAKAYDLLRQEGIIRTNHKSGSVIARGPLSEAAGAAFVEEWSTRLTVLVAEAVVRGLDAGQILERTGAVLDGFAAARARPAPEHNDGEQES